MMSPASFIQVLLHVPYVAGRGDMGGADCFGIVELWFRHVRKVEISDRSTHPAGHGGLSAGFDMQVDWNEIDEPVDHCLVLMRAGNHRHGHIGIYYQGSVLHSDETHGCVYEPIASRFLRSRITGYLARK